MLAAYTYKHLFNTSDFLKIPLLFINIYIIGKEYPGWQYVQIFKEVCLMLHRKFYKFNQHF